MFVARKNRRVFAARHLDRRDLRIEPSIGLRLRKALLRAQGPAVLIIPADVLERHQVFGVPPRMLSAERIIEAVVKHVIEQRDVAHAGAPASLRQQVGCAVHVNRPGFGRYMRAEGV